MPTYCYGHQSWSQAGQCDACSVIPVEIPTEETVEEVKPVKAVKALPRKRAPKKAAS